MKKINLMIIILSNYLFGAGVQSGVKIMQDVIDILTGDIFKVILTVIIIVVGYMYLTNKGQQSKEWLMNILIGAIIILSASGLASMISGN